VTRVAVLEPIIEASNLYKTYGSHAALADVSLQINAGEIVSLIGPSGAGKSTLLRCLNLLELPDRGTLRVDGATANFSAPLRNKDISRIRQSTGMVFQSFNLFPHMTALENVSLPQRKVLGRSKKEAADRAKRLLEQVGLADKAAQYPSRCSGGQQQRIAIARALALDPKVMLFDEPTSALDPELGIEVLKVMRDLATTGMTMVVVTHEMQFAEDVGDRVLILADGAIIEQGAPTEVLRAPSTERARKFLAAVRR
jgi:polar amino acid transport system ATP-binding protein